MTTAVKRSAFARDTLMGLSSPEKFLLSKYFYDTAGSMIFQKIMHIPEYYLTACEYEIFAGQEKKIGDHLVEHQHSFRLLELGPGDGLKSRLLLKNLVETKTNFSYIPIDISAHAVRDLVGRLRQDFPDLKTEERVGDYFTIMKELKEDSTPKVILFLGGNIGNYHKQELHSFLDRLASITNAGDKILIGFDLKKSPSVILKAYDDPHGFTRDFNLNHLARINRELDADFDLELFEHHCSYNPHSGAMKSFLVSHREMAVSVGALKKDFHFRQWEPINMELSRKFSLEGIDQLAHTHGFAIRQTFTDSRDYFADSLWIRV